MKRYPLASNAVLELLPRPGGRRADAGLRSTAVQAHLRLQSGRKLINCRNCTRSAPTFTHAGTPSAQSVFSLVPCQNLDSDLLRAGESESRLQSTAHPQQLRLETLAIDDSAVMSAGQPPDAPPKTYNDALTSDGWLDQISWAGADDPQPPRFGQARDEMPECS